MGCLRDLTQGPRLRLWRPVGRTRLLVLTGVGLVALMSCTLQNARYPLAPVEDSGSPLVDDPETMSVKELISALYEYLEHPEHCCQDLQSVGGQTKNEDGSKMVCEDPPLAPAADSCLVYSFGVADDWSFDQAMSARGCEVHSFDPSITRAEGQTEYGTIFHHQGLSGDVNETDRGGLRLMTVGKTMENLGHTGRTLDYLKVDVEGAEWDWLDMEDDAVLQRVQQLAMEVHFFNLQMDQEEPIAVGAEWYLVIFRKLRKAGFCLVSVRENSVNPGQRLLPGMQGKKATLFELLWVQR